LKAVKASLVQNEDQFRFAKNTRMQFNTSKYRLACIMGGLTGYDETTAVFKKPGW
jgi:hypothetical protein